MSRILPHPFISRGVLMRLWGRTDVVNEFFPDLAPGPIGGSGLINVQVAATSVRRWPGGPSFTRRAHTRTLDVDKGVGNQALPGKRFFIEKLPLTDTEAEDGVNEVRLSFEGPWFAMKAYAFAELEPGTVIRSPGGRAFVVPEPENPNNPALPGG